MLEELHQGSPSGELNWRRKQALVSPGEGNGAASVTPASSSCHLPVTQHTGRNWLNAETVESREGVRCRPARSSTDVCQRGAVRQRIGGGNTLCGVSPHPHGARLALGLVRQGDGIHYPVGQPLLGDSLPFLLTSVIDKELLRASEAPGVVHVYAQYTARAAVSLQALDGRRGQFLQVAAFCRHKCTATALSTWGMSTYPLAAPPSRVARMEEADEPLLAVKRGRPQLHQLLVHFREERNQGRAWSRAMARAEEPIISPRGLGTRMCARLQPRSRGSPGKHGRQLWV